MEDFNAELMRADAIREIRARGCTTPGVAELLVRHHGHNHILSNLHRIEQLLTEIFVQDDIIADELRELLEHEPKTAVSAVLLLVNSKGENNMDVSVKITDAPLRASLVEFDGPAGTGNIVPGIGPTTYVSADPTVATVDPASGQLSYLKAGSTLITGRNAGNGMTASGTLTIVSSGVAQSAVLQFVSPSAAGVPAITQQPAAQSGRVGGTASFSVVATGDPKGGPVQYQWKKNGVGIPGATSPTFTTPVLALTDNGSTFSCDVSNSSGIVGSQPALLTVS